MGSSKRFEMAASCAAFLATGLVSANAFCGGLFAPFSMESAGVLPKGVRSFRVSGFTTEIGDKYNDFGQLEILGKGFNKKITWGELIDSEPAGFDRGQFKGGLEAMGYHMDDVVGDARGIANSRLTATVPVLAYGLTEKLTLGVAVPIVYSNVNVSTGWGADPAFQERLDELSRGYFNKVLSYEQKLQNVVATKLAGYGYKPLENEQHTELGDVTMAMKYQLLKDVSYAWSVGTKLVVPTGRAADIDKLIDVAPGDGQWDAGLSTAFDYVPTGRVTLTAAAAYTYQMPVTRAKRVPRSADETATPDVDSYVREKQGNTMGASLGGRYKVHELWSVGGAYGFHYKERDSYRGGTFAPERYEFLANDTEQVLQVGQIGLTYTTVPLFMKKRFDLPLEASVNFSQVLSGRNVNNANLASFEVAAFF